VGLNRKGAPLAQGALAAGSDADIVLLQTGLE
jgi:hypothetical protein